MFLVQGRTCQGCVRFTRHCGKTYSYHLFSYSGLIPYHMTSLPPVADLKGNIPRLSINILPSSFCFIATLTVLDLRRAGRMLDTMLQKTKYDKLVWVRISLTWQVMASCSLHVLRTTLRDWQT